MTKTRNARIFVNHIAIVAVFFDQIRLTDFFESLFGGESTKLGLHGTKFVDFHPTIVARKTNVGIES